MALDCILKMLKSLVRWHSDMQISGAKSTDLSFAHDGTFDETQLDPAKQVAHLKQQKSLIEFGVELFSKKPKKGLEFLYEKGFIGNSPQDIALLFQSEERLDKTVVGDYLGDGDEYVN